MYQPVLASLLGCSWDEGTLSCKVVFASSQLQAYLLQTYAALLFLALLHGVIIILGLLDRVRTGLPVGPVTMS